jgi:DNA-directed RNA polymerases I, II, and III subunit RPABC2
MSAENDNYFGGADDEDLIGGGSESSSDSDSDTSSDSGSESDKEGGGLDDDDDEEAEVVSDEEEDDDSDIDGGQVGGIGDDEPQDKLEEDKDEEEEEQRVTKSGKKIKKIPAKKIVKKAFSDEILDDDDDEDEDGEMYLKKFDREVNENYIVNNHPECMMQNYDEILAMTTVVRDESNIIIDDLHRTNPFLTKYERARILGQRAKQIETGATPFVKVPENIIDSYLIAEMELQQGRIPFIIRRPLPNGGSEYWKIGDLENIAF